MRRLAVIGLALTVLSLAACNTIEGAGRDLSAAGQAVAKSARDAK